jgi:hypothetical protein
MVQLSPHGTTVEVRRRLARAPLSGRWMVIFVRATVVDSAVSGADDDCYIVRYPACSGTAPSGRMACVPAADVREARRTIRAASKRPSPESSTDGASCKKAKRTGQGIPMDALLRYMVGEVVKRYTDAELPAAPKQP